MMKVLLGSILSLLLITLSPGALADDLGQADVAAARQVLVDARLRALGNLFRLQPEAQKILEEARGYALVASTGLDFGLVSTRDVAGILRDNQTGRDAFYQSLPGRRADNLAAGIESAIIVLQTEQAFAQFREGNWDASAAPSGWEVNAQAAAPETSGSLVYRLGPRGTVDPAVLPALALQLAPALN